ncbi:MAG: TIGR04219 family outer membrane beta-barrel protein [Helicobacteraceae bacterium]|jgi:outer membrane protein|nr:TIGR04219 family outer membrane beta-barrel protein [Helicobacteraceae bacterium]
MKKFLILSLSLCASAFGDLLGFGAGGGAWQADTSGKAKYDGDRFDVEKTGLDKTTNGYLWAYIEHEIPILPNLRIDSAAFSADGNKNINVNFGKTNFNGKTKTDLQMNQIDLVGYYILPIPAIDIRLGLGAEIIDGSLKLSGQGKSKDADLSFALPIVYGGVRFDLPSLPIGLEADVKYVSYDKSRIGDARAKIDWTFVDSVVKAAIELGYRSRSIVIKDLSGVDAEIDITIDGPFAGASIRF